MKTKYVFNVFSHDFEPRRCYCLTKFQRALKKVSVVDNFFISFTMSFTDIPSSITNMKTTKRLNFSRS